MTETGRRAEHWPGSELGWGAECGEGVGATPAVGPFPPSCLPQMSNEIIRLCCRAISLDRIFEGYVTSSKEDLQGCISCCQAWKDHYLQAVHMHTQYAAPFPARWPPCRSDRAQQCNASLS